MLNKYVAWFSNELLLLTALFYFVVAGNDPVFGKCSTFKLLVVRKALTDQFRIARPDNDIVGCINVDQ
ncbi:hypothetical protein D3C77_556040 [compost metagenome]